RHTRFDCDWSSDVALPIYRKGQPVIRLRLEAYLGAPDTYDSVEIEGVPGVSVRIPGGVHGDLATVAMVVNTIPKVLAASPGLHKIGRASCRERVVTMVGAG